MQTLAKERQRRELAERTNSHLMMKIVVLEEQAERNETLAQASARLSTIAAHWLQRLVKHLHDELEQSKRVVSGSAPVKDSALLRALRDTEQRLAALQREHGIA